MDQWDNAAGDWYYDGTFYKRVGNNSTNYFSYAGESSWTDYEIYGTL